MVEILGLDGGDAAAASVDCHRRREVGGDEDATLHR